MTTTPPPPSPRRTALLPWQVVRVAGPSMVPTVRDGDRVIVRYGATIRPGDVVLARFRSLPERDVLKRAVRIEGAQGTSAAGAGWWLVSDNPLAGGDSAVHGIADVAARAVVRLAGGRWPRRIIRPVPQGGDAGSVQPLS